MKIILASLAMTIGLLSTALPAAADPGSVFSQSPEWVQHAFDQDRG
jgi:hypothetical protein